jgi:hypothetical protein
MKRLTMVLALCAAPALADPLGLNDYAALFADKAADVEVVSAERSVLRIGDVTILKGGEAGSEFTGLDESGEAAIGCFVSIVATIESALQACEVSLPAAQEAIKSDYLSDALAFYATNASPAVSLQIAQSRYDALVASQIETSRPFCANLNIATDLADRLFTQDSREEIAGMTSIPRLPVSNPCL